MSSWVTILLDFIIKPTYHPKQFSDTHSSFSPMLTCIAAAAAKLTTQSASISMHINFDQNSTQESLQYDIKQSSSVDDTQSTLLITPENRHREKLLQSKTCNTTHHTCKNLFSNHQDNYIIVPISTWC